MKTPRRQPLSSIVEIYKGGMIQGQEPTPGGIRVKAEAPLSAMFGYIIAKAKALRAGK